MHYASAGIYRKSLRRKTEQEKGDTMEMLEIVDQTTLGAHLSQSPEADNPTAPPLPTGRDLVGKNLSVGIYEKMITRPEGEYVELRAEVHPEYLGPYANDTPWLTGQKEEPGKYTVRVFFKNEGNEAGFRFTI